MAKVYRVTLSADERAELEALVRKGTGAALRLTRARILLKADQGDNGPARPDTQVADARQRFVEGGLGRALNRKAQDRPSRERVLDGRAGAHLVALACSDPPAGRAHWTLTLLAGRLVELRVVDAVSPSTVGRVLKKTS